MNDKIKAVFQALAQCGTEELAVIVDRLNIDIDLLDFLDLINAHKLFRVAILDGAFLAEQQRKYQAFTQSDIPFAQAPKRVQCIKIVRDLKGCDLRVAKDLVDQVMQSGVPFTFGVGLPESKLTEARAYMASQGLTREIVFDEVTVEEAAPLVRSAEVVLHDMSCRDAEAAV